MNDSLLAGTGLADLTPKASLHLAGYPHVQRNSTGVHDPLLSAALYLQSGKSRALIIANDVIYVSRDLVGGARARIESVTGVPQSNILISATHTHSGPKMLDPVATSGDSIIPKADPEYIRFVEDQIVEAARRAVAGARLSEAGIAEADATGIGTNRREPAGARDLQVPVLIVRDAATHRPLAAMLVCNMHPTVLHEDSTLISGDFPAMARRFLQQKVLGNDCVVLYHTGPAGNQSPRHVTRANTFAEATRLGEILGRAAATAIESIQFQQRLALHVGSTSFEAPLREIASETDARSRLEGAIARLQSLRTSNAPRTEIRTAETDWFGAEETLTLARAKASGALNAAAQRVMPAEVQAIRLGAWTFVAWPGEMFVEFGLALKKRWPDTYPIAYANGELQGYLVTREAVEEGGYEASNAIFKSPESGEILLATTHRLLESLKT
jgi:hypothetical protein